jgi:hypothetical protein
MHPKGLLYPLKAGGHAVNDTLIDKTLDALERLMRMFAAERILYLVCSAVAFVLLVVASVILISERRLDWTSASLLFGSTGLITGSSFRVVFFLDKAFDLIKTIVLSLANAKGDPSK